MVIKSAKRADKCKEKKTRSKQDSQFLWTTMLSNQQTVTYEWQSMKFARSTLTPTARTLSRKWKKEAASVSKYWSRCGSVVGHFINCRSLWATAASSSSSRLKYWHTLSIVTQLTLKHNFLCFLQLTLTLSCSFFFLLICFLHIYTPARQHQSLPYAKSLRVSSFLLLWPTSLATYIIAYIKH